MDFMLPQCFCHLKLHTILKQTAPMKLTTSSKKKIPNVTRRKNIRRLDKNSSLFTDELFYRAINEAHKKT